MSPFPTRLPSGRNVKPLGTTSGPAAHWYPKGRVLRLSGLGKEWLRSSAASKTPNSEVWRFNVSGAVAAMVAVSCTVASSVTRELAVDFEGRIVRSAASVPPSPNRRLPSTPTGKGRPSRANPNLDDQGAVAERHGSPPT
jgi:hypothetical protein